LSEDVNSSESTEEEKEPVPQLKFSHNVIEHLGIKLYRNKSGNVLAELLANSWDADATTVDVTIDATGGDDNNGRILMADNGHGMSYAHIRDHYLIVGKPKRRKPSDRSPGGRRPMGRKGLGKLAPFGISSHVNVITISKNILCWFSLDLEQILKEGANGSYPPVFHAQEIDVSDDIDTDDNYLSQKINAFKDGLETDEDGFKSGTLICMGGLVFNQLPTEKEVISELGSRFTVVLLRDDFTVNVNGTTITEAAALPKFELRIPADGFSEEDVGGKPVKFWAGFVGSAEWSSDEAGVGVFTHGKIAQVRPYFFNKKGKEVMQRYLYAVVSADWIDEQDSDLISTDRTSIDWSDPQLKPLYEWGQKKVSSWITQYETFRKDKQDQEVFDQARILRQDRKINNYTESENRQIDSLVSEATRQIGKSKAAASTREELLIAVSKAWINQPTRNLIKDLWGNLLTKDATPESLNAVVSELSKHSVPEAMGLAMTFSQRAYALSVLYELVHKRSETNLQKLVTEFPWILQPRGDLLTADRTLKSTIDAAAKALDEKAAPRIGSLIKGMTDNQRADFVFLTDPSQKHIQIIELKKPTHTLTSEEERQLTDYIQFVALYYSSAIVTGVLIGNPGAAPNRYDPDSKKIVVKSWDEVLGECRASYVELLASMIEIADIQGGDTRMEIIKEIGGKQTWELLDKLAETDEDLKSLMKSLGDSTGATGLLI